MSILKLNAESYHLMLCCAAEALEEKKNEINRLNVFPVPDGDTGSNMSLTLDAVKGLSSNGQDLASYSANAAKAIMRSARGNSGVILSLFFRGMAAAFAGHAEADMKLIVEAFRSGSDAARKAVMNPVEGTILTVMRECTEFNDDADFEDIEALLEEIEKLAGESLKRTPELLPQLKKARVVDSGGYGFTTAVSGMLKALKGEYTGNVNAEYDSPDAASIPAVSDEEIKFAFCTECLISRSPDVTDSQVHELRPFLNEMGDSVVLAADDEIVKVHVHTNDSMKVIERMLKFGVPQFIKVENMKLQHANLVTDDSLEDTCKVIAVASGDGFHDLFMELGAGYVVSGGQSMNPSANDFLKAIRELRCKRVIILPNNKNILLAAKQSAEMVEDVEVGIVETVTVPQGISAMLCFDSMAETEDNIAVMTEMKNAVKTMAITKAVRSAEVDDLKIKRKQHICLVDNKLKYAADGLDDLLLALATELEDRDIVTLYVGKSVKTEEAEEAADILQSILGEDRPLTVVKGGQAVYKFVISAE